MDENKVSPAAAEPSLLKKLLRFASKNAVVLIAFALACITACIVPPDGEYIGYFDFKTLACLFATLAVVGALKNIRFFSVMAQKIVKTTGTVRGMITALVFITYFGSMLIANDMALITFLPLGYYSLTVTHRQDYMAFCFIMQNIAANLGGMLTPFGNPQNLYLYSFFKIPSGEFMGIMALPFAAAMVLIVGCCFFVRKDKIEIDMSRVEEQLPKSRTAVYLVLFALSILIVFRVMPYLIGLLVILAFLLVLDRKAVWGVDYGLLLTFVFFFIFAGNMSRIPAVSQLLSSLLQKNTLLFSAMSCQVISNVPSAVLLSRFTLNYRELLWGVNIGGAGTLIASLASLITFREYTAHNPRGSKKYLMLFSLFNFGFLIILTGIMMLVR
ncbi:MAG: citrate transporter [Clostridia bacterium]|nr:citrate transporter [Clostridia bacterium]